jgi:hypothetical protein
MKYLISKLKKLLLIVLLKDKRTTGKLNSKYFSIQLVILFLIVLNASCKKFVTVPPPFTNLSKGNVYTTDATAASILTGVYANIMGSPTGYGVTNVSILSALSADELTLYQGSSNNIYIQYYQNSLSSTNVPNGYYWDFLYPTIFTVNSAIEGLTNSTSLTPVVKSELLGEAKFMRAFSYFYLTNCYGDVPLVTSTDYSKNSVISRIPSTQIWQLIIEDLKDAKSLLNTGYVDASIINKTSSRVRPNKWAATALLARSYLYTQDWANAKEQASEVINNTGTYSLVNDLNGVFLANSTEAIWQLQPVIAGQNTQDAITFVLTAGPDNGLHPVYLNSYLLNTFEPNDKRMTSWIGIDSSTGTKYYYANKYKNADYGLPVTEYLMVLRLAEQYLIRAEALVQQGDIVNAANDLNTVRNRAGLPNSPASAATDLLAAIQHERQTELFTEWGHRWLDLKRTAKVDSVMSFVTPTKGGSWNSNWKWYPIPFTDLATDPNLIQNSGY